MLRLHEHWLLGDVNTTRTLILGDELLHFLLQSAFEHELVETKAVWSWRDSLRLDLGRVWQATRLPPRPPARPRWELKPFKKRYYLVHAPRLDVMVLSAGLRVRIRHTPSLSEQCTGGQSSGENYTLYLLGGVLPHKKNVGHIYRANILTKSLCPSALTMWK